MESNDRALAHALLRVTLGINICFHGVQRFSTWAIFAHGVVRGFDGILPAALVAPYAFAIPALEAGLGLMLIVGLAERGALALGFALMATLTFGTALRGQHDVLAEQLGYELLYFILLATASWDRWSLDSVLRRKERPAR